ncbi:uncharacterized protein NPIL_313781 [Nephila pilipes]|uniref:Uncharacterized protein n=1 Tax=Nephila pilipes TaxID=299642 RepID=A0A8X6P7H9_NEPPI|nr:uncharacterized protein NPIL_313781 [Nephila pilipes]
MIIVTGKLAHSEILSTSFCKCIAPTLNRFINTVSVKEETVLTRDVLSKEDSLHEDVLKEKEIEIQTCGKLFQKWRKEWKFWSVPKSDIAFRKSCHYPSAKHAPTWERFINTVSVKEEKTVLTRDVPVQRRFFNEDVLEKKEIEINMWKSSFSKKMEKEWKFECSQIRHCLQSKICWILDIKERRDSNRQ